MSNADLTKQLIARKIVKPGTIITSSVTAFGFCDTPYKTKKDGVILEINHDFIKVKYSDRRTRITSLDDIVSIEGMDVERFAYAYKIKPNKINSKS
jgi:hypothetical protein